MVTSSQEEALMCMVGRGEDNTLYNEYAAAAKKWTCKVCNRDDVPADVRREKTMCAVCVELTLLQEAAKRPAFEGRLWVRTQLHLMALTRQIYKDIAAAEMEEAAEKDNAEYNRQQAASALASAPSPAPAPPRPPAPAPPTPGSSVTPPSIFARPVVVYNNTVLSPNDFSTRSLKKG